MMQLDWIDKQILNLLLSNAEQSYAQIAKQIHSSPATVHVRLKKMREQGLITGQRILVEPSLLGYDLCAFLGIFLEKTTYYPKVLAALKEIPEILDAHYVTGAYNIFAKVLCKNTEHLRKVLYDQVQNIEGIQRTESFISLERVIEQPLQLPMNWLGEEDED